MSLIRHSFRIVVGRVAILMVTLLVGCGGGVDGPDRYPIEGKVTYDGKPLPKGNIIFIPDDSKGNAGPGTTVAVLNGVFKSEEGTIGGPHIAEITGYDGIPIISGEGGEDPTGTELFHGWRTSIDLPKEPKTEDFDVPKSQR